MCERRRNGVSDLSTNIVASAHELKAVGEPLQASGLAGGQRSVGVWMSVAPPREAVETAGDRGSLAGRVETSVYVGPASFAGVDVPVARQSQRFWNVSPSPAGWHVREAANVDLRHPRALMVRKPRVHRIVSGRFGKSVECFGDRPPRPARGLGHKKRNLEFFALANDDESLTGLGQTVVRSVVKVWEEPVLPQGLSDFTNELQSSFLPEHRHVLQQKESRGEFARQPGELEHQAIASVSVLGPSLLLRKALARRAARQQVELETSNSCRDGGSVHIFGTCTLHVSTHASPVAPDRVRIGIERVPNPETGGLDPEAQSTRTAEPIHRNEIHFEHHSPIMPEPTTSRAESGRPDSGPATPLTHSGALPDRATFREAEK